MHGITLMIGGKCENCTSFYWFERIFSFITRAENSDLYELPARKAHALSNILNRFLYYIVHIYLCTLGKKSET